jgi:hypothetical protein
VTTQTSSSSYTKLSSGRIVTMSSKFCYDQYFEAAETRPTEKPGTETRLYRNKNNFQQQQHHRTQVYSFARFM